MNELKPVAWHTEDHESDKSATTYDAEVAERWRTKGWPVTPHFLAIPDTHRVVSVELLCHLRSLSLIDYHEDTADQISAIIEDKP